MSARAKLIPPDKAQCQAEKPTSPFRFGGPAYVRCESEPSLIVKEVEPGSDGRRGSMSLCGPCHEVFRRQMGDGFAEVRVISREAK